jgi:hypothetical protein
MKRQDSLEVNIPYSEAVGGRRIVKLRASMRNSSGSLDAADPAIAEAADRAMALLGVSSDLARRCKAQQGAATLSGGSMKLVCERRFWPAKYKGEVDMSTWSADIELP